jgi:hypothetical protein
MTPPPPQGPPSVEEQLKELDAMEERNKKYGHLTFADIYARLEELDTLRSDLQRKTRALEDINACIHWNDTYQTWVLLGRDRAQPALELVRAALNPTEETKP